VVTQRDLLVNIIHIPCIKRCYIYNSNKMHIQLINV